MSYRSTSAEASAATLNARFPPDSVQLGGASVAVRKAAAVCSNEGVPSGVERQQVVDDALSACFDQSHAAPDAILDQMRAEIRDGTGWFPALLAAIARWRAPDEVVGSRHYRYLIGGEAFDWLLLAERIVDALADVIPTVERDALLYHGRAPQELNADEFRRAIGAAKYRAYLNFLYGVTVEETVQLVVEEDIEKERRSHTSRGGGDDAPFERIYGASRTDLLAEFRAERDQVGGDTISLDDMKEFTYWLFKFRLRTCAPPRVASDTTRGLQRLAHLERLRRPTASTLMPVQDVLDLRADVT